MKRRQNEGSLIMYEIKELVDRVKKKDMLAMKLLYQQSVKSMLNLSMRITQDRAHSEDILQESYLTSFQKINQLSDAGNYLSWLKRIVVNNSLRAIKQKRHFEDIEGLETLEESADESWYIGISFDKIKKAIDTLPDGCREVFTLYLLENYKHREISEMLEIAVSTSKSQYRYALKLMKEKLMQYR